MDTGSSYKFIDLFCGIGAFHLALNKIGGNCVFACDIDKHVRETYFKNFNITPHGDIRSIDPQSIPEHEILCAGFPCQAFSISGKQQGFNDPRGDLFFNILKIIKVCSPEIVLLENVKNIIKHDGGRTIGLILESLEEAKYFVQYKVINATDFELPQNRERVYFVCFKQKKYYDLFQFPESKNKSKSLKYFLEQNPKAKIIVRDDIKLFDVNCEKNLMQVKKIGIVSKGRQGERIYSVEGYACTLSAHGGGIGSKTGLYLVDKVIRKLSVREAARIQGFPDSFQLATRENEAYKQLGNTIPVTVLSAIAANIDKIYKNN